MRYARSDLAVAEGSHAPEVLPAMYCFHAQQAAEKAIKAVYVDRRVEYAYIHDIQTLLDTLPVDVPEDVWAASALTRYADVARYPRIGPAPDQAQVTEAVQLARTVVEWAESVIHSTP